MVDANSKKLFGRWVAVGVAAAIVVLGGLSLTTLQLARQAQFWDSHTETVIAEAKGLLESMVDAEAGQRGYIVNGEDSYLQPYREALANVPTHFERLKELTADNSAQQARLALMESLIKAELEFIAKSIDAYRHGVAQPIDKAAMDKFRLAEAAFEQEEDRLYGDRTAALEARYSFIQGLLLAFVLMTGGFAVFGFRKYSQVEARALATLSEEQLRLSIESAPAAIAMFDMNMRYIAASRRYAEDCQIGWDGLVGRSHYEVFPEIPARWREIHRRCLDGAVERCAEDSFQRVDGSTDWASWEIRPWRDPSGVVNGIVLWSENITQRKKIEEELKAAKAEAERANFAKSKFLAAASHDLRQPVQSLTLLMGIIKRQAKDMPKVIELADMAQASVSSLNGMLTGILDLSRLDAGVIAPTMASVDLGELVARLAREYQTRAAADDLELRYVSRPLRATTDATLLERIVRNLIENALRYTAKGGVLVGIRQQGDFVRIDVIDTGVGIPVDQQAEIFEEFRQLNNPARDSSKGLGLGLSIVSRLADLLGIKVEVASRLGRGTRFSLLLPLARSEIAIKEADLPLVDICGRILIIEDNSDVRHAYELMLSDWGYETISVASGEDALDRAAHENWRFDAILADHRLGAGLTGTAASTEIASRANRPFFPTLVLTGDTAKEPIDEIQASGFVMLHKPVSADDLRRALASLLQENLRSRFHGAA